MDNLRVKQVMDNFVNALGTPKALDELVERLMIQFPQVPVCELQDFLYFSIRDFVAQKFSTAYLKLGQHGDARSIEIVQELFEKLTKRPAKITKSEKVES